MNNQWDLFCVGFVTKCRQVTIGMVVTQHNVCMVLEVYGTFSLPDKHVQYTDRYCIDRVYSH